MGTGGNDVAATFGTTLPYGVSTTWTQCSHTDLACLFKAASTQISGIANNGPCESQKVFSKPVPVDPGFNSYGNPWSPFDSFWVSMVYSTISYDFDE